MNNEVIEAAKAVIDRWDSTAEVMNRLRAALSKEPAKLPEVGDWITAHSNIADEFDFNTWVITVVDVRRYIQQLTAAHAADLAEKDAEIERRVVARAVADIIGR